jgi:hypothetical protein
MRNEVIDMVVKAAIAFLSADGDNQLIGDVQGAINGLTNNPNFATPALTLAAVTTALAAFTTAVADAVNGGKEMTVIKKARRAELVSLMRQLASYVTVTSDGDLEKLLSSGFPYQKPVRTPVGNLPAPEVPTLRLPIKSGQLDAAITPIYGAASYNWRLALASAPAVFVQTAQTTGGRNTFEGLTPGQTYNVEVNAVGSNGPSDWSEPGTAMVL